MKRLLITALTLGILLPGSGLKAQPEYKDELRSVWIASVANIDWPISRWDDVATQKADLTDMLDLYEDLNMNAIFLQVRPECDALYQSNLEPWSRYVSGNQGTDPGYDPLAFALEEAHKRGIEVHAWMNPYRLSAASNPSDSYFAEGHIYKEHPEWAMKYSNGKWILNPGRPEVMSYIGSVVRDLLENYELDGVHFDDYFYAYGGTPSELDQSEYEQYGDGLSLGDWRRDNVNRMIDTVHRVVQEVDPTVRFGVSPFGIWRPGNPSGIVGMDAYATIYCDPLAWLEDLSVDYITPQLYWPTGGGQDFESLANWWSDQVDAADRHFYPGHGSYRLSDNPGTKSAVVSRAASAEAIHEHKEAYNFSNLEQGLKGTGDPVAAWTLSQIGLQVDIMRNNHEKGALGSVFFSASDFTRVIGLADYMKGNKYTHKTLLPEMTWKPADSPAAPTNLRLEQEGGEYYIRWDHELVDRQRIAIYVSNGETDASEITQNPAYLQAMRFSNEIRLSELATNWESSFVVTAISATGREGSPSNVIPLDVDLPEAQLTAPENNATVSESAILSWTSDLSNAEYQVQVSGNEAFSDLILESDWSTATSLEIALLDLDGEKKFYWRVRAREQSTGPFSATASFTTGYPVTPSIQEPGHLEQGLSQRPTFAWEASPAAMDILVQISTRGDFATLVTEESMPAAAGSGRLSLALEPEEWYYVRIASTNEYGKSPFDQYRAFRIGDGLYTEDAPETEGARVWPNPITEGLLRVSAGDQAISQICLYDSRGQLIWQQAYENKRETVCLEREVFPETGLYLVRVLGERVAYTRVIIAE